MNNFKCKFCGNPAPNNMQGYCQACYRYFILEGKETYPLPSYGEVTYAPNGDCICPECGKAFSKLGQHFYLAHHITAKEAFKKHGWHLRRVKASNSSYRKHMKEIQHQKCIDINLTECGKDTRFNGIRPNPMQLPIHSMKSRCANCCCLVEDDDGDWYCDDAQQKCKYVFKCPNILEE
jgi:hypothetical protein